MGLMVRILVVAICLGVAVLVQNYRQLSASQEIPADLKLKEYWGKGDAAKYKENVAITPFDITPKSQVIEDLKAVLSRPLKLQEPLEGIGFEYGFNSKELEKVVKYWRDSYLPKWNDRVAFLKKYPHYQTQIQGLNIHYLHAKPQKTEGKKVLPLLILHGWPGSIREFYDIIPLLTTPNAKSDYVFEVIAPSLVGYGWSEAAAKPGFGPPKMAVVFRNLMLRIGHEKFLVQGGDWGSIIGASLAALFPDNVLGYHSNMCNSGHPLSQFKAIFTALFPQFFAPKEYQDFYKPLGSLLSHLLLETGYMHLQATKPDTIGSALAHNPVGLAAYILEKFSTWTNSEYRSTADGSLTKRYTLDALLDNVMIYYVTNSITSSQRLYKEQFGSADSWAYERIHIKPPSGCARFKHDLMHSTDYQLKHRFVNLVHSSHHRDGGHFAAMEVPKKLYEDFIEFVGKASPKENPAKKEL